MLPRRLLDASQRPPRCFLESRIPPPRFPPGSSSRIPPPGFLLQDSSSRLPFGRIALPGFRVRDPPPRIPPLGSLFWDLFSRIPLPEFPSRISLPGSVQGSSSGIPPLGFFLFRFLLQHFSSRISPPESPARILSGVLHKHCPYPLFGV